LETSCCSSKDAGSLLEAQAIREIESRAKRIYFIETPVGYIHVSIIAQNGAFVRIGKKL
jgi:hypothetical protein